jgi:hypothetical protein
MLDIDAFHCVQHILHINTRFYFSFFLRVLRVSATAPCIALPPA